MAKEVIEIEVKSDLGNVTKDLKNMSKGAKEAKKGVKEVGMSFKSIAKASGIIFLLEKAFMLLKETIGKNQSVIDVFSTATTALTIAFTDLFSYLGETVGTITGYFTELFEDPSVKIKELGTAIKDGLVVRFNEFLEVLGFVGKAFGQLIDGEFSKAFETIKEAGKETVDVFTGVDKSFDQVAKTISEGAEAIKKYTTATWKQADAITETAKASARSGVIQAKMNKEFEAAALVQQRIIDNELLSFDERHKALAELTRLTKENNAANIKAGKIRVQEAQDAYNLNQSEENWIALQVERNAAMDAKAVALAAENALIDNSIVLNEQLDTINDEQAQKDIDRAKKVADFKKDLQDKAIAAFGANIDASMKELEGNYSKEKRLAEANGKSTEDIDKKYEQKRVALANKQKAFKVAEALITTYQMANEAYLAGTKAGGPAGVVLGPIAAAVAAAAGLANVRSIMAQDVGAGGGGGGGGGVVTSDTPAPQMMSGAFDISGGVEPEAFKAFVVTDEMSSSQNQLANIRRRATI